MLIEWQESLSIGVPEIDAEHKYLVALVNKLDDDFCSKKLARKIPDAIVHLTKYVNRHFRNEEALMDAGNCPFLKEHRRQHEKLTDELSDLAEKYMANEDISEEAMTFLREWLRDHVMSQDKKIALYFSENGYPDKWKYVPAYSETSKTHFKMCTCCDNYWQTFDKLAGDKEIAEVACMADENNHLYNLITFNCSCGTTLAIPLTDFIDSCDIPFKFEERQVRQDKPSYCLKANKLGACLSRCACSFTAAVLSALKNSSPSVCHRPAPCDGV